MKTAWNIITLVALANVIAIVGFVWWLHFSGRLDMDRVERVREILAETVSDQAVREMQAVAEAEADATMRAEEAKLNGPPVSAGETLALKLEASEIDQQRLQRLRREVKDLTESLARERRMLDSEMADFKAKEADFETMRAEIARIEGDAQFAKSVAVLDSIKPKEAKDMIAELVNTDRAQAVSYLNAMEPRSRSKVLTEFNKSGQTALATELLEEIRVHGLEPVGQ